ncbi:MAG: hypothetical protein GY705_07725 [Bacteroidetes bacterium]|nr:hypothetical protein [Bacteroidota bacterium]
MDKMGGTPIKIDLNEFKLHIYLNPNTGLTLHFDTPSRRFYLAVIALVISEMKKKNSITSIPLHYHLDELVLLNKTIGKEAGSSKKELLLNRIYRKWKDALPDLENAPLFKVIGRKKRYDDSTDKIYVFGEMEKDSWANLFEYMGSHKNVRLKFALNKLALGLADTTIVYGDSFEPSVDAWNTFIMDLKQRQNGPPGDDAVNAQEFALEPASMDNEPEQFAPGRPKRVIHFLTIGLIIILVGFLFRQYYNSVDRMALPEKPSIAVLAFDNMSGDPEQGYLSDGLTDELIGDLAKIKDIFVISRNSAFTYKGKTIKIKQVAKELNVRYVLEGSFQRSGEKVRIRAQLIDGKTDHHIWSESYDGVMDDIFELQDEITEKIVTALTVTLSANEKERLSDKGTDNIFAYQKYLKGFVLYSEQTPESILESEKYYRQALELDPNFTRASAGLAMTYRMLSYVRFGKPLNKDFWDMMTYALRSRYFLEQAMNHPTWEAYRASAYMETEMRRYDKALSSAKKAYALAPNESLTNLTLGAVLVWLGSTKEALLYLERSMELDPKFLEAQAYFIGLAHITTGNYQQSIDAVRYVQTRNSDNPDLDKILAVSYGLLGQKKDAATALEDYLKIYDPNPSANDFYYHHPWKDRKIFDRYLEGLIKAGFKGSTKYYKIDKQNRLNGQEINKLVLGRTLITNNGLHWQISEKGDVKFPTGSDPSIPVFKGKFWIENHTDTACFQFKQLFDGIKFCSEIYRNSEADANSNSDYMSLHDMSLTPFSIQELKQRNK